MLASMIFLCVMGALLIAGIGLPAVAMWRWRGRWRLLAGVPLAVFVFVILRIAADVTRDPTSHNLWPFEIIMFGALSILAVAVLWLLRRFPRLMEFL